MNPQPESNGIRTSDVPSDLEAIMERVAPDRRAAFLRLRQKLQRHDDNDELLAVLGYLDTAVVLMDLTARQAQPEAVTRALAAVEKAAKAADRFPRAAFCLSTAVLLITAALGPVLGILVKSYWDDGKAREAEQARSRTVEAMLAKDLAIIGGKLELDVPKGSHQMTIKVSPGNWSLTGIESSLDGKTALVMLAERPAEPVATRPTRSGVSTMPNPPEPRPTIEVTTPAANPTVEVTTPEANSRPPQGADWSLGGEPAAVSPPGPLTKREVEAMRDQVVARIDALPGTTDQQKTKLIEKMEKARSMERLSVIRFRVGQTALPGAALEALAKRFDDPQLHDRLSDPTLILVVAGYADAGGDAKTNTLISQERAENVSKILAQRLKLLNVIKTIGMGGTALLDGQRPDQNRAVEIWAVEP
jgi:outer membrane protein OmpA-like peptidoglycan-associated protein